MFLGHYALNKLLQTVILCKLNVNLMINNIDNDNELNIDAKKGKHLDKCFDDLFQEIAENKQVIDTRNIKEMQN